MFLEGAQDDWTAPPRPWLLVVRRAVQITLYPITVGAWTLLLVALMVALL